MPSEIGDYTDKLYDLYKEAMQRAGRIAFLNFAVAVLTWGIVTGMLAFEAKWEVGGISIASTRDIALFAFVAFIAVTYTQISGLSFRGSELLRLLRKNYQSIASQEPELVDLSVLRHPNLGSALSAPELIGTPPKVTWLGYAITVATLLIGMGVPFSAAFAGAWDLLGSALPLLWKVVLILLLALMVLTASRVIPYFARRGHGG